MKFNQLKWFVFILTFILLFSLASCGGEGQQETTENVETTAPESTEETVPPAKTMDVYWNLDRFKYICTEKDDPDFTGFSNREKEDDGLYHVNFVHNGELVTVKFDCNSRLINKLDDQDIVGLVFDDKGNAVDIKSVADLGGSISSEYFYVKSIDGKKVTTDSSYDLYGQTDVLEIKNSTVVCDVTDTDAVKRIDTLYKMDRLVAVRNGYGDVTHIFMYTAGETRKLLELKKVAYCEHCKQEVEWTPWAKKDEFPVNSNGHYYLLNNIEVSTATWQFAMGKNVSVVLDLNGKKIHGDNVRRIISLHNEGAYLALMDNSEAKTGAIVITGTEMHQGTCVWVRFGTFEFYSGTLDASGTTSVRSGTAVAVAANENKDVVNTFNMYGGKIIGGTNVSVEGEGGGYGGAVSLSGNTKMTMSGGEIYGGTATSSTVDGVKKGGQGGNVFVPSGAVFEMTGGRIYDGTADNGEGNVHVAQGGTFTNNGGTIG